MNSAGHIKNILLLLTEPIILRYCTWKNYKELLWHKLTIACGEEKDQDAGDQEGFAESHYCFWCCEGGSSVH